MLLPFFEFVLIDLEGFGLRSKETKIVSKATIELGAGFGHYYSEGALMFFAFGKKFNFEHTWVLYSNFCFF